VAGSRSCRVTATVKALDLTNREITLEGAKGQTETVVVRPEVQKFDQVHVGDRVVVKYVEGLMIQVKPPVKPRWSRRPPSLPAGPRPARRQEPGSQAIHATVTITPIDVKNRMVVFEGPRGNLYQVKAGPGVHLDKAKVGDKLVAIYTEAMVVTVEPAKKRKAGKKSASAKG
jgi:hypothetical protein